MVLERARLVWTSGEVRLPQELRRLWLPSLICAYGRAINTKQRALRCNSNNHAYHAYLGLSDADRYGMYSLFGRKTKNTVLYDVRTTLDVSCVKCTMSKHLPALGI